MQIRTRKSCCSNRTMHTAHEAMSHAQIGQDPFLCVTPRLLLPVWMRPEFQWQFVAHKAPFTQDAKSTQICKQILPKFCLVLLFLFELNVETHPIMGHHALPCFDVAELQNGCWMCVCVCVCEHSPSTVCCAFLPWGVMLWFRCAASTSHPHLHRTGDAARHVTSA